jgi:antitoxin ParD1/3/4
MWLEEWELGVVVFGRRKRLPHLELIVCLARYYGGEVAAMNVSLTPELEKVVQDKVKRGCYSSASEVVGDALRMLEQREIQLQELRARMDKGLADLDRGDFVDGEEFMQRMIDELDLQEADRKAG